MVFMNDDHGNPEQVNRTWLEFLLNLLEKTSYIPDNPRQLLQFSGKIIPSTYMAHAAGNRAVKDFKHITRQGGWRKPGFYLNTASYIACATSCVVAVFCKIGPTARLQAVL